MLIGGKKMTKIAKNEEKTWCKSGHVAVFDLFWGFSWSARQFQAGLGYQAWLRLVWGYNLHRPVSPLLLARVGRGGLRLLWQRFFTLPDPRNPGEAKNRVFGGPEK